MSEVRLNRDGALCCPRCEHDTPIESATAYLHHGAVTVYSRREDAERVVLTQVSSGKTTTAIVPSLLSGNPSARRDGLKGTSKNSSRQVATNLTR
jgi:hypothetical protein